MRRILIYLSTSEKRRFIINRLDEYQSDVLSFRSHGMAIESRQRVRTSQKVSTLIKS